MRDFHDYSLKEHNTFGIDAKCCRFLEYGNIVEAKQTAEILRGAQLPFMVIGSGSNLLLTKDYEGIVVHSAMKGISSKESEEYVDVRCGSGETWDDVVAWCVCHSYGNMVNLSLIPGEVGASAVQNIGAYGSEAGDFIHTIHAIEISTGKVIIIPKEDCDYGYRSSKFKKEWRNRFLITEVTYRMALHCEPNIDYGNIRAELERKGITTPTSGELRQTIIDIRNAKLPDPKEEGNAGSFFMNPVVDRSRYEQLATKYPSMPHYKIDEDHEKIPAGWMIEKCGWKGKSLGRAGVHAKQALVLVNRGGANGSEIVALSDAIRKDVKDQFGIDIFPEVNIV